MCVEKLCIKFGGEGMKNHTELSQEHVKESFKYILVIEP